MSRFKTRWTMHIVTLSTHGSRVWIYITLTFKTLSIDFSEISPTFVLWCFLTSSYSYTSFLWKIKQITMTFETFPFNCFETFFFYLFCKKRLFWERQCTKGKKKKIKNNDVTFALSVECVNVPPTVGFVWFKYLCHVIDWCIKHSNIQFGCFHMTINLWPTFHVCKS